MSLIAQVLYLTTFLDKWGSGVGRIMELCKEANVPAPFYSVGTNEVILTFPRPENSTTQKTTRKTEVKTTQKTTQKTTRKTAQKILELIKQDNKITKIRLAELCGISYDGIKWQIDNMQTKGIIRRVGGDNGGHWEIME